MTWSHAVSAESWEAWESLVTAMGNEVKDLKTGGADKEAVDAAVAELMHRKNAFKEALEQAISSAPDEKTAEALKAKLPAPPKQNKQDKKKEKKEGAGGADAEKAANIKAQEEAKMAARAKKKAEAEAKKGGAGDGGNPVAAAKPAVASSDATPPAAAAKAAAKPAAAATAAAAKPVAASAGGDKKSVLNKTTELWFGKDAPPLLAVLMARLAKREVALKKVEAKQLPAGASAYLLLPLGAGSFAGEYVVARYFARLGPPAPAAGPAPPSELYGVPGDAASATAIDEWLEKAEGLTKAGGPALAEMLAALNQQLAMRTVIEGHVPSLADGAVWLALKRNPAAAKAPMGPHAKRWLKFMEGLPACVAVAREFLGAQKDGEGSLDLSLKEAEMGKVVTRFPPEPSGHLHIGHVKAAMLNAYFAEKYEGKMLLRFDDTNPSKEKEEYEEAIKRDLGRLKITPHSVSHTSDHFDEMFKLAERMIKEGNAYCDPSPQETQQKERFDRIENAYRSQSVEENLRLWKEMHKASEEGLACCLRAKIDMKSDNGAMRDPAIYRCNLTPHAQTKEKWKAYPTYDFACPIVDSIEGVTHTLRDSQYADRNAQYRWFEGALTLRHIEFRARCPTQLPMAPWRGCAPLSLAPLRSATYPFPLPIPPPLTFSPCACPTPHVAEPFSRINFVKTLLSKRKLQWLIDQNIATDWDDARFPTVAGVLRRGMQVDGLKEFIISMGASNNTNLMEWDKIWATSRAVVDPIATRYTALLSANLVPFKLENGPAEAYAETLFRHPKDQVTEAASHTLLATRWRPVLIAFAESHALALESQLGRQSLGKKVRLFARTVWLQQEDVAAIAANEEVTLMSWGNAIVRAIEKGADGKVTGLSGELHLAGDVKKTKKKLTWLADTPDNLVDMELIDLDFLLLKDKIEEEDDVKQILNYNSILPHAAKGEAAMRTVKKGEIIQVERRGFYICDVPYVRAAAPMKFFFVPDGKKFMGVEK